VGTERIRYLERIIFDLLIGVFETDYTKEENMSFFYKKWLLIRFINPEIIFPPSGGVRGGFSIFKKRKIYFSHN
jgi:hypothetical protein